MSGYTHGKRSNDKAEQSFVATKPAPLKPRNLLDAASRLATMSGVDLGLIAVRDPDMIRDVAHALETFYRDEQDTFSSGGILPPSTDS